MTPDFATFLIVALLPLTALLVITQTNPYQALIMRGILGAVAALVYALFGAADVALTEALVGTMLSITLYAIAVRSSMGMRLGVLEAEATLPEDLASQVQQILRQHHLRLQPVPYPSVEALEAALSQGDVHGIYAAQTPPRLQVRVLRLYTLLAGQLPPTAAQVTYCGPNRR